MSKSICILCTAHPPDDGRVTHKIGHMLASQGFRVTWVGPRSPFTTRLESLDFRFYEGVTGKLGRLFQAKRLERACLSMPEIGKFDVFFAVEPDSASVAIRLARRFNARSVFDIHEMYHEEMLKRWVPKTFRKPAGAIVKARMKSLCRRADLSIGAGYTRIMPYQKYAKRHMVLRHCLSRADVENFKTNPMGSSNGIVRIMHGKATAVHGTREVMRAAVKAQQMLHQKAKLKLFCFDSLGGYDPLGADQFRALVTAENATELLELHKPVPFKEMLPLLATCDIGVIAYGREFGVNCMPNRIFEYMAVGMPVIVPNYSVELTKILERYPCGTAVATEDSDAIAHAIVEMVSDKGRSREMGRLGRQAALGELSMENEIRPLTEWILDGQPSAS